MPLKTTVKAQILNFHEKKIFPKIDMIICGRKSSFGKEKCDYFITSKRVLISMCSTGLETLITFQALGSKSK